MPFSSREGICKAKLTARNQRLDILRGVAILLVLGRHHDTILLWSRMGWAGVDLFFVLSGFLISGLLFSEYKKYGRIDIKRFWIRRGFKIYPPFYALMLLTILYSLIRYRTVSRAVLGDLFFLQNYISCIWTHGWSLAVEEHFYVLLPLLLLMMIWLSRDKENPFRAIPMVSIALTIACLYQRIQVVSRPGVDWDNVMFPTHLRVDSLFVGVVLGYYNHFQPDVLKQSSPAALFVGGSALLVPALLFGNIVFVGTVGLMLVFLGFACILIASVTGKASKNIVARALAGIGYYSYSIYLWHAVPNYLFFPELHLSLIRFAIYVISAIALGIVMARLIESPSLVLRDRWFRSRSQATITAAQTRAESIFARQNISSDGELARPVDSAMV
jgi:peptidoglycan/LPS O-acetylase OafA/YrhL